MSIPTSITTSTTPTSTRIHPPWIQHACDTLGIPSLTYLLYTVPPIRADMKQEEVHATHNSDAHDVTHARRNSDESPTITRITHDTYIDDPNIRHLNVCLHDITIQTRDDTVLQRWDRDDVRVRVMVYLLDQYPVSAWPPFAGESRHGGCCCA